MTYDLQEIYYAALSLRCKISVVSVKKVRNDVIYFIKITDGLGMSFTVTLCSDHSWSNI